MAKNTEYEFEETMVTLTDEDGIDKDFYVDEIYEVDGRLYAALIPGFVENITEYYVFRIKDLGNDDFELEDINDEEEYDAAADAYEERLDARAWSESMKKHKTALEITGFSVISKAVFFVLLPRLSLILCIVYYTMQPRLSILS